jgi:hypothetical protein
MSGEFGQRGQQQDVGGNITERIEDELPRRTLPGRGEDRRERLLRARVGVIGPWREISGKFKEFASGCGDQTGEWCVGGDGDAVASTLKRGAKSGQWGDVAVAADRCNRHGAHRDPPTMRRNISIRSSA